MSLELIKLKNKEIKFLKDENKVLKKKVEELENENGGLNEAIVSESFKVCENCVYDTPEEKCNFFIIRPKDGDIGFKNFGCNKWESK